MLQYFSFIHLVIQSLIHSKIFIGCLLHSRSLNHFHFPFCVMIYLIFGPLVKHVLCLPTAPISTDILYNFQVSAKMSIPSFHEHFHVLSRSSSYEFSELHCDHCLCTCLYLLLDCKLNERRNFVLFTV